MRDLNKNKQTIWYSLYNGRSPIYELDSSGQPVIDEKTNQPIQTGEYVESYSEPVEIAANVSSGVGDSDPDFFGVNIMYDLVICTVNDLPITETSLIWKDTAPQYSQTGTLLPDSADYFVTAIRKSLNSTLIAIKSRRKSNNGNQNTQNAAIDNEH